MSNNAPVPGSRRRVMVLFGGQSAEHDVSRVTAVAVARALDPAKYDVVPVGITTEGRWLLAGEARRMLATRREALPVAFAVEGEVMAVPSAARPGDADVVIPLLHGPYGEDGTVQGLLELAGLPYVGSGVLGSAVAMDKIAMKRMFTGAGLENARALTLRAGHDVDDFVVRVEAELGFPCFVKPANMGSSVGVSKAHTVAELRGALEHAFTFDEWVLAEEMVVGREIEVGILGDDPPVASLPGEVIPAADFYDYADKYEDGKAELSRAGAVVGRTDRRSAAARRAGVRGLPRRGNGARRFLPPRRRRVRRQRGEHHSRIHAHLDVPAAVGGVGSALRRAPRPAHRPRDRPSPPPVGPPRAPAVARPRRVGTMHAIRPRRPQWPSALTS